MVHKSRENRTWFANSFNVQQHGFASTICDSLWKHEAWNHVPFIWGSGQFHFKLFDCTPHLSSDTCGVYDPGISRMAFLQGASQHSYVQLRSTVNAVDVIDQNCGPVFSFWGQLVRYSDKFRSSYHLQTLISTGSLAQSVILCWKFFRTGSVQGLKRMLTFHWEIQNVGSCVFLNGLAVHQVELVYRLVQ